jgi:uncharacterized protein (TIGR02145 family)
MKRLASSLKHSLFIVILCLAALQSSCEKKDEIVSDSELGTIIDYDGNSYSTIQLGDQRWMVKNLKTTHYADGTEIPLVENVSDWEDLGYDEKAYCYYNNSEKNEARIYGALYTWAAAMNGAISSDMNPSEIQGVCPDGWHLPSDDEWKELEMSLGMSQVDVDIIGLRGSDIGSMLASSPDGWVDGYLDSNPVFGSSGFNAKPGGGRRYDGTFGHKGDNANFWTATEYSNIRAWGRHIYSSYSSVHRYMNVKSDGFSVRCIKDN